MVVYFLFKYFFKVIGFNMGLLPWFSMWSCIFASVFWCARVFHLFWGFLLSLVDFQWFFSRVSRISLDFSHLLFACLGDCWLFLALPSFAGLASYEVLLSKKPRDSSSLPTSTNKEKEEKQSPRFSGTPLRIISTFLSLFFLVVSVSLGKT